MNEQRGLTLIEILIALLLGIILIGATITVYIITIRGSADTIRAARLNHDLDSALLLMVNDIRRAGYWGGAVAGADSRNNPFMAATTNVLIYDTDGDDEGDCILYTYDANGSGINTPNDFTDDVDANEYYGFRLNNGVVEMRLTGNTTAVAGCGNVGQSWQAMTISDNGGESLNITRLAFSFDPIADPDLPTTSKCLNTFKLDPPEDTLCEDTVDYLETDDRAIETRQVNIVIAGQLANDATVTKTVSGSVRIRNDRIFTQP